MSMEVFSRKLLDKLSTVLLEGETGTGKEVLARAIHVDVRFVAATNVNVKDRIAEGTFREDLYYRLNVVSILVPPLRTRKEDIPLLAAHFLSQIAKEHAMKPREISNGTLGVLQDCDWPGNVRQLRNCIETMMVLSPNNPLSIEDIPKDVLPSIPSWRPTLTQEGSPNSSTISGTESTLEQIERQAILDALRHTGNRTAAARKLKVSRSTLYRKMKRYGLELPDRKGSQ